jgi:hypothetical protein
LTHYPFGLPHLNHKSEVCYCCSCRCGETMTLNCGHQQAYCWSPRWYLIMESHGVILLTGQTEDIGEKTVPVPPCPSQIPRELTWGIPPRGEAGTAKSELTDTSNVELYNRLSGEFDSGLRSPTVTQLLVFIWSLKSLVK